MDFKYLPSDNYSRESSETDLRNPDLWMQEKKINKKISEHINIIIIIINTKFIIHIFASLAARIGHSFN